jgi:hypothetical protein
MMDSKKRIVSGGGGWGVKRKGEMGGSTYVCSVNSKRCTMARLLTGNGFGNRKKPADAVITPGYLSNIHRDCLLKIKMGG